MGLRIKLDKTMVQTKDYISIHEAYALDKKDAEKILRNAVLLHDPLDEMIDREALSQEIIDILAESDNG